MTNKEKDKDGLELDELEKNESAISPFIPRWLELAQTYDADNLRDYKVGEELSNNGIALVSRGTGGYVYKRSLPFLIENEIYCLQKLCLKSDFTLGYETTLQGYTPRAIRFDKYTIRMEDLGIGELVIDIDEFMSHKRPLEDALRKTGIRHGDLTVQAIIVRDQKPFLIDFAESRFSNDPRPDKRPEGDAYWLDRTFMELCNTAILEMRRNANTS